MALWGKTFGETSGGMEGFCFLVHETGLHRPNTENYHYDNDVFLKGSDDGV
jgi:hypothetical protein